jgi:hypothetical protein
MARFLIGLFLYPNKAAVKERAMRLDILVALKAIATEYAEGRGPLVKFAKQNEALMAHARANPGAFRKLGVVFNH